jgi:hypothetical protein
MATSTKRAMKRDAQKALKKELTKTGKRVKSGVSLETIKRDRDLQSINEAYATRESSANSQVQWVSDVLKLFASDKKNFAIDDAIVKHLVEVESEIRMAARKRRGDPMPTANKRYVGKSQFVGVLRMAKIAGGVAMWKVCAEVGNNWALSQELASKCRSYRKDHKDKWPSVAFVEQTLAKRKAKKAKSAKRGGNGGGIKLGGPALIKRINDSVKELKARNIKLIREMHCEVDMQRIQKAAAVLVQRLKEHEFKLAAEAKLAEKNAA